MRESRRASPNSFINLVASPDYNITSGSASVVIHDESVTVTSLTPTVFEGDGEFAVFEFTRVPVNSIAPLTVFYTIGGDAAADEDYQPQTGSIRIPANVPPTSFGFPSSATPIRNPTRR